MPAPAAVGLWLMYVLLSSFQVYELIPGF